MAVPKVHQLREIIAELVRKRFPQGKKNYKWKVIPEKWPKEIPFLDPNNNNDLGKKPTKDELTKMYEYLMALEKVEPIPASNGLFDCDILTNEFGVMLSDDYEFTREVCDSDDLITPKEFPEDNGNGSLMPSSIYQNGPLQCTDTNDYDFNHQFHSDLPPFYMDEQFCCTCSVCELVPGCNDENVSVTFHPDISDLESLQIRPKTYQTMDIIKESNILFSPEEPTSLFNGISEFIDAKNEDWTIPNGYTSKCNFEMDTDRFFSNMEPSKETKGTEMASATTSSSSDSETCGPPQKKVKIEDISQNNQSCFKRGTHLKQDTGIDPTRKKPPKNENQGPSSKTWLHI